MVYLYLLLGLVVLVVGAELLVRGAVALAEFAKISPLVIGLTVVAFGTSAPELAVSSVSSLEGDSAIALGNVIGSNIFNVLLILGLSAVIVPLSVSAQLVRLDVPIMIIASIAVGAAASDGSIDRWEGIAMLLVFFCYTGWLVRAGRMDSNQDAGDDATIKKRSWKQLPANFVLLAIGLGLLVWGAQLLVDSATSIAKGFGVSDLVIGLTIVAAGTSLPELATSIVAAVKGQRDIAVGNVIGSNVFNLLMVLATAAIISPSGVPVAASVLWFDVAVMIAIAVLCWPIFLSHSVVSRIEGGVMLVLYLTYMGLLMGDAMGAPSIASMKSTFVFAILPLVFVGLSLSAWSSHRGRARLSARIDP